MHWSSGSLESNSIRLTSDVLLTGRARSSIAHLYRWRYKKLGDLSHINDRPAYKKANAGFRFDYQVIDVPDFNGVGESEPNPHFYQVR